LRLMFIVDPYSVLIVVLEKISTVFCKSREKEFLLCTTLWLINIHSIKLHVLVA